MTNRLLPGLCLLLASASALEAQTILRSHPGGADQERQGAALAGGADTDGDGRPDYAVGAPGRPGPLGAGQGRCVVHSGASGAVLRTMTGSSAGEAFGAAVHLGVDVDGDAVPDLIVGAPARDAGLGADQGGVEVRSGATGAVLFTLAGSTAGDRFGAAVLILGDLNADGRAEFAVGAPEAGGAAGLVTVYDGLSGALLHSIPGSSAGERLGSALAVLGDVDGDGIPDFVAGAPGFDGIAGPDCGRIQIFSGAGASPLLAAEGGQAGEAFGTALAAAGDLDHDQNLDLVVGAPLFDGTAGADCGRVTALRAGRGGVIWGVEGSAAGDRLGTSVAGGADLDADGFPDVALGAPGLDGVAGADSGAILLRHGRTGAALLALEGTAAGDGEGAVALLLADTNGNLRGEVLTGAPEASGSGVARGRVRVLEASQSAASQAEVHSAASSPTCIAAADVDGDGDLDLVVAGGTFLSVLWNGDHTGGVGPPAIGQAPRADFPLSPGAAAISLAAGQLDGDPGAEIVIGRSDGTLDIIDVTGSGAGATLSLAPGSPVAVDLSGSPGALSGVALLGSGASAQIACAGAGSLAAAGFVRLVSNPLGAPAVGPALVSGGSFAAVAVGDLDGDTVADILAANATTTASGGLHVLLGPGFAPATGSPFVAGGPPRALAILDLDGDGLATDVALASLDFTAGGVRVLAGYGAGLGFAGTVDLGLVLARDVAAGDFDADGQDDLGVLDGGGSLLRYEGWTGTAFAPAVPTPISNTAAVALLSAQFTRGVPGSCDGAEIATAHPSAQLAGVWRRRRLPAVTAVLATGCPSSGPISRVTLSGDPVIGSATLAIQLVNASPWSLAFLVLAESASPGIPPGTAATGGCGYVLFPIPYFHYFALTDSTGRSFLGAALPFDPCLIDREFHLQWAVLDGGPILGAITVSDATTIRIGEP
jgi:hypothetical protein